MLYAHPDFGVMAPLTSPSIGGVMARRMIPAMVILPVILAWLRLQGQYLGFYDLEFGLALFVAANIIVISCLVWRTSALLNRLDEENRSTDATAKEILHLSEERLRLCATGRCDRKLRVECADRREHLVAGIGSDAWPCEWSIRRDAASLGATTSLR